MARQTKITRLDPPTCGCTDCIVGRSVPLDQATAKQVARLIRGKVTNATGTTFRVRITVDFDGTARLASCPATHVEVLVADGHDDSSALRWTLSARQLRLPR